VISKWIDGLRKISGVQIQGITNSNRLHERVPTVSLTHPRSSMKTLARRLGKKNIAVWSGHNYALEVVRQLGIDEADGVLRIGLAHYNTAAEIDRILDTLMELITQ
jgi:selenocysteine lyase/cysteine desulfurase